MQDLQTTLSAGMLIRERYMVKRLIRQSSSGAVYQVVDQRAKKPDEHMLVLKELIGLNEQEQHQLIFDSIQLRNIHHASLPRIHHVFNDDKRSRVCIVMEYVEGFDLETVRQQQPEQRLGWQDVAQMMAPVVDVVSYLHHEEPPIIHGDIRPANIFSAPHEEKFMLVGIEIDRQQHPDARDSLALSSYKTSAQSAKEIGISTDIYGIAATCYTLLTGTVPPNISIRAAHFEQAQADLLRPANSVVPDVPSRASQAIHRAMSLHNEECFSSIEEFWQAFQAPPKELTPAADDSLLPTPSSTPVVTEQIPVLAEMHKYDFSKRGINNKVPFFFLRGRVVPLLLLILLLILILLSAGTGTWLFVQSQHASSRAGQHSGAISPTHRSHTAISKAPVVTPTSSPGSYPAIFGSYTGTLADLHTNVSATMILQGVHQVEGIINGYLTVGSPLEISGSFKGTIDFSKHFSFTVTDATGHPVLFLEGAIQSASSISGDFYRCASPPAEGDNCSHASGNYGIWSALLVTSEG